MKIPLSKNVKGTKKLKKVVGTNYNHAYKLFDGSILIMF